VLDTFTLLGSATQRESEAASVVQALQARVDIVRERSDAIADKDKPRVAMLEWIGPLFNVGHWTPELVAIAGGKDCLGNPNQPSVSLSNSAVYEAQPDVLFVAPCGFDLSRTEQDLPLLARLPGWADLPCVRDGRVYYTDGNAYFSRAGPRLVESLEVLAHALHPDVHPISACGDVAKTWRTSS